MEIILHCVSLTSSVLFYISQPYIYVYYMYMYIYICFPFINLLLKVTSYLLRLSPPTGATSFWRAVLRWLMLVSPFLRFHAQLYLGTAFVFSDLRMIVFVALVLQKPWALLPTSFSLPFHPFAFACHRSLHLGGLRQESETSLGGSWCSYLLLKLFWSSGILSSSYAKGVVLCHFIFLFLWFWVFFEEFLGDGYYELNSALHPENFYVEALSPYVTLLDGRPSWCRSWG